MNKLLFLFIFFTVYANYGYSQTCTFTSSGKWDKSGGGQAGYSCDVGFDLSTATDIYIASGVEVTIEKQTSDVQWSSNVIVEGTLVLKTKLILNEVSNCNLTLTIANGGVLTSSNGNGANELLIICGTTVLSNSQGSGIHNWEDFPDGEITGPQSIDDTGGTLPVELIAFNAKVHENQALIMWATASELNNHYFTLERSRNGKDFELLATVQGNGTTSEEIYYQHIDKNPHLGLSYYRLSQTDYDGTKEVFPLISVLFDPGKSVFTISPNPLESQVFKLKATGFGVSEQAELNILDLKGNHIEQKQIYTDQFGNIDAEVQLSKQLKKGTYILELISGDRKVSDKIVAQ